MAKSMKWIPVTFTLAMGLFLACKSPQLLPADHVSLQTGASVRIPSGLTLTADSVQVSICPANYNCFAPNSASLVLNLSDGTKSQSVRLFAWIPNYNLRRPVYFTNATDSTGVELGGQRYKVILRDGRLVKSSDSQSGTKGEAIVQVSRL